MLEHPSINPPQSKPVSVPKEVESPYAPRRGQGQMDQTGRLAPQARPLHDDEQLDIPAFLRRQAD